MLEDARVSWRHATISWNGRSWVIDDHGSTNGTFIQGQRIHQLEIGPGSAVFLGNATDGPRLSVSGAAAPVAQQPFAAQGGGPGWAQQPTPQASTPAQNAQQAGAFRSSRGPAVARGHRRSTATAARRPSTSSRWAA